MPENEKMDPKMREWSDLLFKFTRMLYDENIYSREGKFYAAFTGGAQEFHAGPYTISAFLAIQEDPVLCGKLKEMDERESINTIIHMVKEPDEYKRRLTLLRDRIAEEALEMNKHTTVPYEDFAHYPGKIGLVMMYFMNRDMDILQKKPQGGQNR